ncbi:hypothetical protein JI664_14780 [Rhodobacter sp. NTK016B]|uniref:hypothetical protein n=1 Tax=Rhodobacter sp. NTK016B TaxID=2759676 RepID=UPI001A8D6A95|nr:hypothetical protein [Rhodobacter sp. NTK016B]MBN8293237.1 hypothetical protein [Rhodobacter sp. NTK016B]
MPDKIPPFIHRCASEETGAMHEHVVTALDILAGHNCAKCWERYCTPEQAAAHIYRYLAEATQ